MITVIINEDDPQDAAEFTVHEGMLVEHSDFFKAACRNGWKEAISRVVKLPQVDADTFRAYLCWVYESGIAIDTSFGSQDQSGGGPLVSAAEAQPTSLELAKLWLLADRLTTTKLRNDVIDTLLSVLTRLYTAQSDLTDMFPASMTVLIWSATTESRALRKLVVDYYASTVPASLVQKHIEEYPPEFVQDLMLKGLRVQQNVEKSVRPTQMRPGFYHEDDSQDSPPRLGAVAQDVKSPTTANIVKIRLTDKDGVTLHAEGLPSAAPHDYVHAVLSKHQHWEFGQTDVILRISDSSSRSIHSSRWRKSFGDVSTLTIFRFCLVADEEIRLPQGQAAPVP